MWHETFRENNAGERIGRRPQMSALPTMPKEPSNTLQRAGSERLVSRMICQACAKTNPVWQAAWDAAMVATPGDDPIPCSVCGLTYQRFPKQDRGWIMDCLVPNNADDLCASHKVRRAGSLSSESGG